MPHVHVTSECYDMINPIQAAIAQIKREIKQLENSQVYARQFLSRRFNHTTEILKNRM